MGDRANVVIVDGEAPPLFLYTHWGGSSLPGDLSKALNTEQGRSRWQDGAYLARIIHDYLVKDSNPELGHGISTYPVGPEHDYLVVYVDAQEVRQCPSLQVMNRETYEFTGREWPDFANPTATWAFIDFATLYNEAEFGYAPDDEECLTELVLNPQAALPGLRIVE